MIAVIAACCYTASSLPYNVADNTLVESPTDRQDNRTTQITEPMMIHQNGFSDPGQSKPL
jgi:hypothetical protein